MRNMVAMHELQALVTYLVRTAEKQENGQNIVPQIFA
jgi:hypothetical protein